MRAKAHDIGSSPQLDTNDVLSNLGPIKYEETTNPFLAFGTGHLAIVPKIFGKSVDQSRMSEFLPLGTPGGIRTATALLLAVESVPLDGPIRTAFYKSVVVEKIDEDDPLYTSCDAIRKQGSPPSFGQMRKHEAVGTWLAGAKKTSSYQQWYVG